MADSFLNKGAFAYFWQKLKILLGQKVNKSDAATETAYGLVKLNPSESVTLNGSGQLKIGGRLGQFQGGGIYYPPSASPVKVGNYSLLISEAVNLSAAHRNFIVAGGSMVDLKTAAAAGATQYRVSNTMNNRFVCAAFKGGRLAVDEAGASSKTVAITSVKFANGNDVTAYSGGTESGNDIIITVSETLNPSGTLSKVRGYGTWATADILSAGQGNRADSGKVLQVGQALTSEGGVNQIIMVGIRLYNKGRSSALFGQEHINKKGLAFLAGQGHDSSNGSDGVAAVGTWSEITADTAFAVGNGTSVSSRKNAFEVRKDGGLVLRDGDGKKWVLSVGTDGQLSVTAG